MTMLTHTDLLDAVLVIAPDLTASRRQAKRDLAIASLIQKVENVGYRIGVSVNWTPIAPK